MNDIKFYLPVEEQIQILKRGVADLVSEDDLRRKLTRSIEEKKPLRVKLGADPTRPDLHLGHAVILRKMRQFQDLGHKVIMLIGDFTAIIGDPTGKSKTRPPVTLEQTRANAQSYLDQCKLILRSEPEVLELRYNSEWLEPMGYADVIRLASRYTVARIMERDDFKKRFESGTPISMHELLYPLTQGYDSVALNADVELGGTDQLFNNLVGRALQRDYGQEPQVVMTLPLLVGLDGVEKMSKSLDNYIGLTDKPEKIYEKLMKVPDKLLSNYFTLLTDLNQGHIAQIVNSSPMLAHKSLAKLVTSWVESNGELVTDVGILKLIDQSIYYSIFNSSSYPNISKDLHYAINELNKYTDALEKLMNLASSYELIVGKDDFVNQTIEYASPRLVEFKRFLDNSDTDALLNEIVSEPHKIQGLMDSIEVIKNSTALSLVEKMMYGLSKLFSRELLKQANVSNLALQNESYDSRFQSVAKGGIPENIPTVSVPTSELSPDGTVTLARLMVMAGLEASLGAARRTIQGKGLKVDGQPFLDPQRAVSIPEGGLVIQKGKDKFARMMPES